MMLEDYKQLNNKSYKQFYYLSSTHKYSINGSNQELDYYSTVLQEQEKPSSENALPSNARWTSSA